jgi:hypothetical protein
MKYSKFNTPFEEEKNDFTNFGQNVNQNFGIIKDNHFSNKSINNNSIQNLKNNLNPTKFSSIFNNDMNSNINFNNKINHNKRNKANNLISYKGKKFILLIFRYKIIFFIFK